MARPDDENPHPPEETDVLESDPSGNGPQGLAGDMGVSSERTGPVDGTGVGGGESTHGTVPTQRSRDDEDDVPPEQSAGDAIPEENPAEAPPHDFDAGTTPGHSHG